MNGTRTIEIVGGGLAGLSLGLALQRAGVRAAVAEAGDYPRHRVCGEFITGLDDETVAALGLAPLLADAPRHRGVVWFIAGKIAREESLPKPAIGLSRHALDARLADAFVAAGGELRRHTRVTDLSPQPGRVFATGRRRGRSPWIGLKVHVRNLALVRDLELHLGEDAYVGLSRVEDGAINVCGLFRRRRISIEPGNERTRDDDATKINRRGASPAPAAQAGVATLLEYLDACGLGSLRSRLCSAEIEGPSFCAVAGVEFDARIARRDRILLGDACAMIPPFTGNGMAMAFQSAVVARDPLRRYAHGQIDWAKATRATNAALRARFRLRLASAGALHTFLLQPQRQRWFAALSRARLLPFRPLYAALH